MMLLSRTPSRDTGRWRLFTGTDMQVRCGSAFTRTCSALKTTAGVRGERVALLSRSCSSLFCRPQKSVGGLRVWVPQYWTELKASGKRESFLKRSSSSRSTDSDDLSGDERRWRGSARSRFAARDVSQSCLALQCIWSNALHQESAAKHSVSLFTSKVQTNKAIFIVPFRTLCKVTEADFRLFSSG